jgi:hypothetical protein
MMCSSRMNRCVPAVLALLATFAMLGTFASPARAQDSIAVLSGDRETAAQLARIVNAARERGLPVEPIIAKAQHGARLHASPAKIVAAAQAVARRLNDARDALAPRPTPGDIAAGEDALSITGVSTDALRAVRAVSPTRPVAVPIGVLAQLVASGVPAPKATAIVTDIMKRGATNKQLVALGTDVNADVVAGTRADAALGVRLNGLTPFLAPGAGGQAGVTAASLAGGKKP